MLQVAQNLRHGVRVQQSGRQRSIHNQLLEFVTQVGGRCLLQMVEVNAILQHRIAVGFQKIRRIKRMKNRSPTEPIVWVRRSPKCFVDITLFHFSIIPRSAGIFKGEEGRFSRLENRRVNHTYRTTFSSSERQNIARLVRLYKV